jgi:predicted dehydrogenase
LNVALVGCGKIADAHIEEIGKIPNARVTAVCDLEPIMARQLAVRYGVPQWFDSIDRMLAASPFDVVHLTTPPQSHPGIGMRVMDAGCHLFIEKPLALDAAEGRRLVEHAIARNRKLTINYWYNFETPGLQLRRLVDEGTLGEVVHIDSYYGYNLAGDYGRALLGDPDHWVHRLPGKLFHNVLDHLLNKIAPFLTDDAPSIASTAWRRRPAIGNASDGIDDELRVVLRGERVSAHATFSAHAKPVGHWMRVYGTKKTAFADYNLRTVVIDGEQLYPSAIGRLLPPFQQSWRYFRQGTANLRAFANSRFGFFAGMQELIGQFYASIRKDGPPPIPYSEILRVAEWMDSIFSQTRRERETPR